MLYTLTSYCLCVVLCDTMHCYVTQGILADQISIAHLQVVDESGIEVMNVIITTLNLEHTHKFVTSYIGNMRRSFHHLIQPKNIIHTKRNFQLESVYILIQFRQRKAYILN